MGKRLIIFFLIVMLIIPSVAFTESIDLDQMDMLFKKIRKVDENKRDLYVGIFKDVFKEDENIDAFANNLTGYLNEADLAAIKSLGYSESEIKSNIRKLKTWSKEDRNTLIELGVMDNQSEAMSKLEALNEKNASTSDDSSEEPVDDDGGLQVTPPVDGLETEEDITTDDSLVKFKEELEKRGLITKPLEVVDENRTFEDVKDHWSKEYVEFFAKRDIINGRSPGEFEPDGFIKEGEIIKLLMVITVENSDVLDISDITLNEDYDGKWYVDYIKQAKSLGIVSEETDGTHLEPEAYPKREKIIHLIVETLKILEYPMLEEIKVYQGEFSDFDTIDPMYRESIIIAKNLGLIHGNANGTLTPKRNITRGEVSKVMKGFYQLVIDELTTID